MRRIGLGLLCTSLLLAPAATPHTRADGPAAEKSATRPAAFNDLAIMPMDRIDRVPLGDVLAMLKARQPAFHYAVFRSPDVPADYPVLPPMSLDGVTVRQFFQVVQSECPGVKVRPITNAQRAGEDQSIFHTDDDAPPGTLMLFDIRPTDGQVQNIGPMAGAAKAPPVSAATSGPAVTPTTVETRVYRISSIVALIAMRKTRVEGRLPAVTSGLPQKVLDKLHESIDAQTKQATNDVLSLLQATLDAADVGPVMLKAHEATQTIVFRGPPAAQAVLERTLETLSPSDDEKRMIVDWQSSNLAAGESTVTTSATAELQGQLDAVDLQIEEKSREVDELKKQLDVATRRDATPAQKNLGGATTR